MYEYSILCNYGVNYPAASNGGSIGIFITAPRDEALNSCAQAADQIIYWRDISVASLY
jgi:hypothetical protein